MPSPGEEARAEAVSAVSPAEVVAALRRAGVADVSGATLERGLYSSDASLYRVVPTAVARPRDTAELAAVLAVCRALGVPLTCRGAGTSIAGNAVGGGVVADFSAHMGRILSIDPHARTATVQPGVVQDRLQRAVTGLGLRFGPDPSTRDRCTVGGMIGNNACGSRSLRYGRTVDNVQALEVLTAAGDRLVLTGPLDGPRGEGARALGHVTAPGPPGAEGPAWLGQLRQVVADGLAAIRTELGRFPRQASGYALEHLLPERGFDLRRALVGSEGTLCVVTEATVRLIPEPAARVLAVLGYPDMVSAADAVPEILAFHPMTCEGLDSRIVNVVRARRGGAAVPALPRGSGWLLAEVSGDSEAEAVARARALATASGASESQIITDSRHAAELWRIRSDGAGLASRTQSGGPAWPGWEDSAVPAARLGPYLRALDDLLAWYGLAGIPYGHFGEGCLHLRLDFPLEAPGGRGVLREFLFDAARLVTRFGGSLSGEHGDGRSRSELLPIMYSGEAMELFRRVKRALDPGSLLNPGVVVDPAPLDAGVRAGAAQRVRAPLALARRYGGGDFTAAVHRCVGVGKCVADTTSAGGVMCPSYLATRREKDSTRGRARILQEMVNGGLVTGGWRSPEVSAALDLCLSCRACSSECPAGVDMATYKAEVLYQAYRGRPRPRSHYALGWLPWWARPASAAPRLVSAALAAPGAARALRFAAGIDQRRELPPFARRTFRSWYRRHVGERERDGRPLMLVVDTFTNYFDPGAGVAAVRVLEEAGFCVSIPDRPMCCGLTWITTGQLGVARRVLRRALRGLSAAVWSGASVVGLEPSCTAVLRSDAPGLLPGPEAEVVAASVRTLSETLGTVSGWRPPDLRGTRVIAQPHCHHSSVMGWDADQDLLRAAGARLTRVGGCCGMAGNFGVERGHYEVSAAVARTALLPAVASAAPGDVVLADGFSCRRQLADLAGRRGLHLAELLAGEMGAASSGPAGAVSRQRSGPRRARPGP